MKAQKAQKKAEEEARKAELAAIFKPVVQVQKVAPGTDPKTVLCAYFKAGQCLKGDKCKFSHDVAVERKSAKIDLYTDSRKERDEGMDGWDQAKLEQVVASKKSNRPTTEIVCKYFIEAVEKKKYGFFWECPNGRDCIYRHALPPGFVLKSQKAKQEEEEEQISLEEFLETERHKLGPNTTPVTAESFAKWKQERKAKQEAEERAVQKSKETQIKAGKLIGSGKDLFTYRPELFADDEEAMEVDYSKREEEEQEQEAPPIEESLFLEEDLDALAIED